MDFGLHNTRRQYTTIYGMLMVLLVAILWRHVYAAGTSGYFNNTSAILKTVINLRKQTVYSIRTCSSGQVVYQKGISGDYFNMSISKSGALEISWRVNSTTGSETVGKKINSNSWFTIDMKFTLGDVRVTIEEGANLRTSVVISNSSATYRRYLWDIQLAGGDLIIGGNIVACISEGSTILLSEAVGDTGVKWNTCPLQSQTGCGSEDINDCWSQPCKNGATCKDEFKNYSCECATGYSGRNCEQFLGSIGCSLEPCQHNSTCDNVTTSHLGYECKCLQGYAGVNCETDIDECLSSPCKNGATCTDGVNSYTCNCSGTGYKGLQCAEDIDECKTLKPCSHGKCRNTYGSYKCDCDAGYGGKNCAQEVNECLSNPCQNGGTCHDYLDFYNCTCPVGYAGVHCQENVNDCLGVTCPQDRHCKDGLNTFTCECKPGYTGPSNSSAACQDVNECDSNPCKNNATCSNLENAFNCSCVPGFEGTQCEVDIDECSGKPCQNGRCRNLINHYECDCDRGWEGVNCSVNINECKPQPCKNGATCDDLIADYNCTCSPGWMGKDCTEDILECASNPCMNSATCKELNNGYKCDCVTGFNGTHCENNIDDCAGSPCFNHGTCIDGINMYTCNCTDAWMGKECRERYNACSFRPCKNNATCNTVLGDRDYNCTCLLGFEGRHCETNIDDCVNVTCPTGMLCIDLVNNYTCACPKGYTGVNCTANINECAPNPCKNNGTCNDGVGTYTCKCDQKRVDLTAYGGGVYITGYNGTNCENAINECDYKPMICLNGGKCDERPGKEHYKCYCTSTSDGYLTAGIHCEEKTSYCSIPVGVEKCENGGTCKPIVGGFECACAPGFEGKNCSINIDECESNPCQYNGTCHDKVNGYTCDCLPGLNGSNCEININECESNPCQNEGQCIDKINSYECNCTDTGFNGTHCELNIDDCVGSPCQNGGNCTDMVKDYNCSCFDGYKGKNCEVDINECEAKPCQYNGTCLQKSNKTLYEQNIPGFQGAFNYSTAAGFVCHCLPGFKGVKCEINIDECDPDPCDKGNCTDGYNKYTCNCLPGYKGVNCTVDIDECQEPAPPCKNGGNCTQKIADYDCACPTEWQGKKYAGKNCSTELTGCVNNECQNQATCIPFLVDEAKNIHNYTCTCTAGYAGRFCNISTTASFNGTTYWAAENKNTIGVNLELSFRTTVDGILASNTHPTDMKDSYYLLEIKDKKLILNFKSPGLAKQNLTIGTLVADAAWHRLHLQISDAVNLTLHNCPKDCMVTKKLTKRLSLSIGTSFGALAPNNTFLSELSTSLRNYVGCTQDIVLNGTKLLPTEYVKTADHLSVGCPRTEVCKPDPCNNHGTCVDMWTEAFCNCRRPYYGKRCEHELPAATFGLGQKTSLATFTIDAAKAKLMEEHNDISMFLRTRNNQGFILYVGGDMAAPSTNRFIAIELVSGKLSVRTKFGDQVEVHTGSKPVSDGEQHYLELTRDGCNLTLRVQGVKDIQTHLTNCNNQNRNLTVKSVYMGSLPGWPSGSRRKRSVNNGIASSQSPLVGTVQDGRLGMNSLQLYKPNVTGSLPIPIQSASLTNVAKNEVTDDMCKILTPCQHNGTCQNVFYNDYNCTCQPGYTGKNCSRIDFCLYSKCPDNATCRDKIDGYECISPATFDGKTSKISYNLTVNSTELNVTEITLKVRTRGMSGVILDAENKFRVLLVSGKVKFQLNRPAAQSGTSIDVVEGSNAINDGVYHNVTIKIGSEITLDVDGKIATETGKNYSLSLPNGFDKLTLGGAGISGFKGCIDDVNINSMNLPVFMASELVNDTSVEKFYALDIAASVKIGCIKDPVCDANNCTNNSTCVDVWNKYTCSCVLGFNGTFCGNNIDDCPGNCSSPGVDKCVDGVNSFTCSCKDGYNGTWCENDINECATNPCKNNGTCTDKVAAFECNCTGNYTGNTCEVPLGQTCAKAPCKHGTCVDVNRTTNTGVTYASFDCRCEKGWTGDLCDTREDYCKVSPCKNNATCTNNYTKYEWTCKCVSGYEEDNCGKEINECAPKPCKNNGNCTDLLAAFNCSCPTGWEGATCENDIDECNVTTSPCQHSGKCNNLPGTYACDCAGTGYDGIHCENEIDECKLSPPICKNGAQCENKPLGNYTCNCTPGYTDKNCSTANCSAIQCQNNGNCSVTSSGQWKCDCPTYYEGSFCEKKGPCADAPCKNSAKCTQDISKMTYTCECQKGWEGKNCSEDINECKPDPGPCQHGKCANLPGSYNCTCDPGYKGVNCTIDINECEPKPCQHGGKCLDKVNKYECNCMGTGFEGTDCQTNIDECKTIKPCLNGGDCEDTIGSFKCNCTNNYVGKTCHSVNPCNSSLCQNGGTCRYNVSDLQKTAVAYCQCPSGFFGVECEKSEKQDLDLIIIIAPIIAVVVLVLIIVIIVFVMTARKKRATRGTYSPSRQELEGSRVEMGNVLKQPPEERLI